MSKHLCFLLLFLASVSAFEQVCYDFLGCFSLEPPWVTQWRPLPPPSSPEEIDLHLYYSDKNVQEVKTSGFPNVNLYDINIDWEKPSYFITHGSNTNSREDRILHLKEAIHLTRDANVFMVDWGPAASGDILKVTATTRVVGRILGRIIANLIDDQCEETPNEVDTSNWTVGDFAKNYISFGRKGREETTERKYNLQKKANNIHLIGHSLGAQISGYAGRYLYQHLKVKVRSIIGLEPSQRFFEFYDPEVSLSKTDALTLIVAHTEGRLLIPYYGLGFIAPLGHIDFFFNGGITQPGCPYPEPEDYLYIASPENIRDTPRDSLTKFGACSHWKALEYLTESLLQSNCAFRGLKIGDDVMDEALSGLYTVGERGELYPESKESYCCEEECPRFDLDTYKLNLRGNYYVFFDGMLSNKTAAEEC